MVCTRNGVVDHHHNDDDDDDFDSNIDITTHPLMLETNASSAAAAAAAGVSGHGGIPGGSVIGAVFNLTTSIIGAGIMALPATMKLLGPVLGLVFILFIGILSEISVEFLVRFSVLCKASSYGDVVCHAMGKPTKVLSQICIIVNNAGVLVVYLIIIGDVMSGSPHHVGVFYQWFGDHDGLWNDRKLVILVVLLLFLAPLCALERIDSLSLTSAASVILAVVFVVVCVVVASIKLFEGKIYTPRLTPDFSSKSAILDLLVVIPIMSNAYVCHFNVQPIYNELDNRSPKKMNQVGRITTAICVTIYAFTALSCYLLFGKDTESDVLTNFDKDLGIRFSSTLNYIVRIGYVLHLVLVFPVVHFSLRETVSLLLFEGSAPLFKSRKRRLALTAVLLGLIYFGSTMIPNIWTAFKFTGATTAVSLGFIFPPLVALRLSHLAVEGGEDGLSSRERTWCWVMIVLGAVVSFLGLIGNIYSVKNKSR